MSYSHQLVEYRLATAASLTAAADIVTYHFLMNHQPRRIALRVTTTATVTAPVVDVYWRPTAGSDTGRVLLKRITALLADWAAGNWVYGDMEGSSANAIRPGGDMVVEVSTTATAGAADVFGLFSPDWEVPQNVTVMKASTTA